jgi:hypothetical protein
VALGGGFFWLVGGAGFGENRVRFLSDEGMPLSVGVGTLGSFGFFPCFALPAAALDCLVAAFLVPLLLPVAFGWLGTGGEFFAFFLGGSFASVVAAGRFLFPVPRGRFFFFWVEVMRFSTLVSTTFPSVGMSALGSAASAAAVA